MTRSEFLQAVFEYVQRDPEAAPEIVAVCSAGVGEALKQANIRAADFEAALMLSLTNKKKANNAPIWAKINKWRGKSSLNWENL